MLDAARKYLYDRRRGLFETSVVLCGAYAVSRYFSERLQEIKENVVREKAAREALRRRFQSTHDDACYTIMALIPTLAEQILEEMDVESLANELQSSTRTKAQLWKEVKVLTLTRMLTTIYTTTLLSLLTAIQLALLARERYLASVFCAERTERIRETAPTISGLLLREAVSRIVNIDAIWCTGQDEWDEEVEGISEETEMRFLTLSWWILHVGWKDIAARVRGSVEAVFEGVSLKTTLSTSELQVLILDVRRRVECDGAGENRACLSNCFLSSLLPATPDTIAHVLAQGGALPQVPSDHMSSCFPFPTSPIPPLDKRDDALSNSISSSPMPLNGVNVFPTPPSSITTPSPSLSPSLSMSLSLSPSLSQSPSPSPSPSLSSNQPTKTPPPPPFNFDLETTDLKKDPTFSSLLSQTRTYLAGPDFSYALNAALDRAMEVLVDGLREKVFVHPRGSNSGSGSGSGLGLGLGKGNDKGDGVGDADGKDKDKGNVGPEEGSSATYPIDLTAQEAAAAAVASAKTQEKADKADKEEAEELKIRLANLLPGLARWSLLALNAEPNELVDNIMAVRELGAMEAIVMSDYEDRCSS